MPPLPRPRRARHRRGCLRSASTRSSATTWRDGRETLLDPYGRTSQAELFAVATECFFERPVELRERHPELFDCLRDFYKIDPAAWFAAGRAEHPLPAARSSVGPFAGGSRQSTGEASRSGRRAPAALHSRPILHTRLRVFSTRPTLSMAAADFNRCRAAGAGRPGSACVARPSRALWIDHARSGAWPMPSAPAGSMPNDSEARLPPRHLPRRARRYLPGGLGGSSTTPTRRRERRPRPLLPRPALAPSCGQAAEAHCRLHASHRARSPATPKRICERARCYEQLGQSRPRPQPTGQRARSWGWRDGATE